MDELDSEYETLREEMRNNLDNERVLHCGQLQKRIELIRIYYDKLTMLKNPMKIMATLYRTILGAVFMLLWCNSVQPKSVYPRWLAKFSLTNGGELILRQVRQYLPVGTKTKFP